MTIRGSTPIHELQSIISSRFNVHSLTDVVFKDSMPDTSRSTMNSYIPIVDPSKPSQLVCSQWDLLTERLPAPGMYAYLVRSIPSSRTTSFAPSSSFFLSYCPSVCLSSFISISFSHPFSSCFYHPLFLILLPSLTD